MRGDPAARSRSWSERQSAATGAGGPFGDGLQHGRRCIADRCESSHEPGFPLARGSCRVRADRETARGSRMPFARRQARERVRHRSRASHAAGAAAGPRRRGPHPARGAPGARRPRCRDRGNPRSSPCRRGPVGDRPGLPRLLREALGDDGRGRPEDGRCGRAAGGGPGGQSQSPLRLRLPDRPQTRRRGQARSDALRDPSRRRPDPATRGGHRARGHPHDPADPSPGPGPVVRGGSDPDQHSLRAGRSRRGTAPAVEWH